MWRCRRVRGCCPGESPPDANSSKARIRRGPAFSYVFEMPIREAEALVEVLIPKSRWPTGCALAKPADSARIGEVRASGHPFAGPACGPPCRPSAIGQSERRPTGSRAPAHEGTCSVSRCVGCTCDPGVCRQASWRRPSTILITSPQRSNRPSWAAHQATNSEENLG